MGTGSLAGDVSGKPFVAAGNALILDERLGQPPAVERGGARHAWKGEVTCMAHVACVCAERLFLRVVGAPHQNHA